MNETNAKWELDANDIKINHGITLGKGSFGVVKRGILHGMTVAIKIIAESASTKETEMAAMMLRREVKALSRVQHQNVVRLIGACSNPPMLVLAFAEKGTLRDLLRHNYNDVSSSRKMELLRGVCDGMAMLHSKDILHLDLKPENVLISANGTPWVADFGLAIAMTATLTGGAGSTKGGRGTMQYKAPEHFADSDNDSDSDEPKSETKTITKVTYDKPADVYSFAMLSWEMFSGVVPFAGKMDHKIIILHRRALNGGKVKRPSLDGIPSEVVPFIEACWAHNPTIRPTFKKAKDMLDAVPIVAVVGASNAPGHWDIFIGHSRRCADAVVLGTEAATYFEKKGMSVWFDVRMNDKSEAAMEEGVKNSQYFVAVISGSCVNNDRPNDDPVGNAYFRRPYCIKELRWAQEAGKFIQPILRIDDKLKIGEFLGLLDAPLKIDGKMQDISDLKCLGSTDMIDLNRNDNEYWELGMKKVCRALKAGEDRLARKSQSNGTSSNVGTNSSSTVTSSTSTTDTHSTTSTSSTASNLFSRALKFGATRSNSSRETNSTSSNSTVTSLIGRASTASTSSIAVTKNLASTPATTTTTTPSIEPTTKIIVCFSYRSLDKARVEEAKTGLEKSGYTIFWGLDVDMAKATDWRNQWMVACDDADICVNFLSSSYVQSQACSDEWNYSMTNARNKTINVVLGGSQGRKDIDALPLVGEGAVAANGGAAIKMHFTSGGQALSIYASDNIVEKIVACTLFSSIGFALAFNNNLATLDWSSNAAKCNMVEPDS